MRKVLDGLYQLCAVLSALALLSICLLVLGQIQGRFTGIGIPSANELAGYGVLASTFLALAPSFRFGTHIRVKLVLERLNPGLQRFFEFVSLSLAIAMVAYASWWCVELVRDSIAYGDTSAGYLRVPLAIPQSAMAVGLTVFLVSLVDCLVSLIRGEPMPYDQATGIMEETRHGRR